MCILVRGEGQNLQSIGSSQTDNSGSCSRTPTTHACRDSRRHSSSRPRCRVGSANMLFSPSQRNAIMPTKGADMNRRRTLQIVAFAPLLAASAFGGNWLHQVPATDHGIASVNTCRLAPSWIVGDGAVMDGGRKRVIGVTAILASLHMQTADDLFGCPQGSPRTER